MHHRKTATRRFAALLCLVMATSTVLAGAAPKIDYANDVQPILSNYCYACHGPDTAHRKAHLRLDLREAALSHEHNGVKVILSGDPDHSELVRRVESHDPDELMPQDPDKRLSPRQIATLRAWVAQGAEFRDHWAFEKPVKAALPAVHDEAWGRNPIDRFVLAKLEAEGLKPAAEADRRDLIRRVTLDLTGLLPTPDEVDAFVVDPSPNAYEKVVDRLLDSPRYGEHRARYWMDYARFGDTQGLHVDAYQSRWPYRDWVIRAFNDDMPYDQFTIDQLAGDLLPPTNVDQLVATGLVRCGIATGEGGTIIEELRVNLARERTEMLGAVYLGLTTGCAVCHDHKYDPLTTKDFYALSAFFNNIAEKASTDDRVDWPPSIYIPKAANRDGYNAALTKKAEILRQMAARRAKADELLAAWLKQSGPKAVSTDGLELRLPLDENYGPGDTDRTLLHNTAPHANPPTFHTEGPEAHWGEETNLWPTFRFETNTKVNLSPAGDYEKDQAFSVGGWIKPRNVPGGRYWNTKQGALIARMDADAKFRGWDLYYADGALVVQLVHDWPDAISVKTVGTTEYRNPFMPPEGSNGGTNVNETLPRGRWSHVMFTYDGSGKAAGVKVFVNGVEQKLAVDQDNLTGSIRTSVPTWLGRRHDAEPMQATGYQDIRFYKRALSPEEVDRVAKEDVAAEIVSHHPLAEWTADQRQIVEDVYFERYDEPSIALAAQLPAIDAELMRLSSGGSLTLICREKPGLAYADMLRRGSFGTRIERVEADTPHFLPPMPAAAPHNRLGLAQWLVSPDNPLTARVTVNRIWQEVFGSGIVQTSEDLGIVGERPSHPKLLDWLAVDFRENGWKVKRFYKMLVMSATYRQSVHATPQLTERDPTNRLLARGPRFRMDGEMLRDMALQTSGLLVESVGGPSVKPYQPAGVWDGSYGNAKYTQEHGANLYRRSLYTFWKRMAPMPNMEAFDATDRSSTCVRRQRTNTPLAALVLMNDPQFLESARRLGARVIEEGGSTDAQRIDFLGRMLRAKPFDETGRHVLLTALEQFRDQLNADPSRTMDLLSIGESPHAATDPQAAPPPSLTTNKPATASLEDAGHPASLANDGQSDDTNRFWSMDARKADTAWWQVDLLEPTDVGCVVVVGYYGDNRYYGFTVETSLDGRTWDLAADRRDNKQRSTEAGVTCTFPVRKACYIRVTQTSNSANPGRHLVEVMAYRQAPRVSDAKIEQAVWMMMATTLMNSDEVINK
ncbi:MAG: DUF1553 domain-containing protein [Planctomycetes bacterium]|nr:DUF1553 domain-containing protein [Planctomycetota bacterium]